MGSGVICPKQTLYVTRLAYTAIRNDSGQSILDQRQFIACHRTRIHRTESPYPVFCLLLSRAFGSGWYAVQELTQVTHQVFAL